MMLSRSFSDHEDDHNEDGDKIDNDNDNDNGNNDENDNNSEGKSSSQAGNSWFWVPWLLPHVGGLVIIFMSRTASSNLGTVC